MPCQLCLLLLAQEPQSHWNKKSRLSSIYGNSKLAAAAAFVLLCIDPGRLPAKVSRLTVLVETI